MKSEMVEITARTYSEEETFQLAEKIARNFAGDEVVLIIGELGAGKTVFVKGLACGLGVDDERTVCSPSFTLVNIYQGRVLLYHVDLYRLEDPEEIADLGLEDYFGAGVVAIEWAERLPFEIGGVKVIRVLIEVHNDDSRTFKIYGLKNLSELAESRK
jgi:tRNA threonylcarbamoyladenosine biosynthesis protein TsaE